MNTVTKTYRDLPAAHRAHNHEGHCRFIHGHNWSFDITFEAQKMDENGFVVDVGDLGPIKDFLVNHFDHTLLLNQDDPMLSFLKNNLGYALAMIRVVPNNSMEGLAEFVYDAASRLLEACDPEGDERGLAIRSVTCWEDSKNRATYE